MFFFNRINNDANHEDFEDNWDELSPSVEAWIEENDLGENTNESSIQITDLDKFREDWIHEMNQK